MRIRLAVCLLLVGCSKKTIADGAARSDAGMNTITVEDAAVVLELSPSGGREGAEAGAAAAATSSAGASAVASDGSTVGGGDASAGTTATGESSASAGDASAGTASGGTASGGPPADPHPTEGGTPAGVVTFDKIDTGSELPADAVQKFLTKNRDLYRSCYGKALGIKHSTAGTLNLKVVVLPTGVVEEAEVIGGSLPPSPLIQCSVAKTKRLRFSPAPSTRATMKYEVSFSTP